MQYVCGLTFLERRIYIACRMFVAHAFRTKNIHCVWRVCGLTLDCLYHCLVFFVIYFRSIGVPHAYRMKNIHCVSRVCGLTHLERRIYIVCGAFVASRIENEEYTLCVAHLWPRALRTKNIHCVSRVCGLTLMERSIYIVCAARLWSHA